MSRAATILLVAGEPSGDRHAASLVRALATRDPTLSFVGLGGEEMRDAGVEILYDLPARMAIMGVVAVLARLPRIGRLLELVRRHLDRERPDLVIVVDYPGFNLQVAELAHARQIPVAYFIAPQVWAWAPWRIHRLGRITSKLLVILPFEEEIYTKHGYDARFVGHPLTEQLAAVERTAPRAGDVPILGLLPGSRTQEVRLVLPTMLAVARALRDRHGLSFRAIVAPAKPRHVPLAQDIAQRAGYAVEVDSPGRAHALMARARACLVTSGTATLETAMLQSPMVILYKVSRLAHLAVRATPFLTTPHFGLVNIVAGREVVPERLYSGDPSLEVAARVAELWVEGEVRTRCLAGLAEVKRKLETPRPACETAALEVLAMMGRG